MILRRLATWTALTLTALATRGASAQSTAFFYGPRVPEELLAVYDRVVVEPAHDHTLTAKGRAELVAYLSIGEIADSSVDRDARSPSWVLARNDAWGSAVMDLTSPGFQKDLFERRFAQLLARGYRTFFLDTLDSYQLASRDEAVRERQRRALVEIVKRLDRAQPDVKLILNRGFELLDEVAPHVDGVVAESLFSAWNPSAQRYESTPKQGQAWLLGKLREAHTRHKLPVTVIDYVRPGDREAARKAARRIAELGFMPWIAEASLTSVGVGHAEIVPRRVLLLTHMPDAPRGTVHDAERYLTPVLEHLGYVVEHHDLRDGLPEPALGSLAGIVSWLDGEAPAGYGALLRKQIDAGVRVVMFRLPGLDPEGDDARALGFAPEPRLARPEARGLRIRTRDALAQFEAAPIPSVLDLVPLRVAGPELTSHLVFETASGAPAQALVSTRWGAWVSSHFFAPRGIHGERAWTIDPFAVLSRALGAHTRPAPDLTTENGLRLALFVVRGQGLAETSRLAGRPPIASLLRNLLARHPVPHALDLEVSDGNHVTAADQRVGLKLLAGTGRTSSGRRKNEPIARCAPGLHRERLDTGSTKLTSQQPFLTQLTPLVGAPVRLPMASDYHYIPPGVGEAYAYRACAETIALSEVPRRLMPIALDYHASSLASDGGHAAIGALYDEIFASPVLPIRASAYADGVRAFGEQVIVRDLDGSYRLYGGAALRTVRVPKELGELDLARSVGVASYTRGSEEHYLTFLPTGPRQLAFRRAGESSAPRVHLTRVNAEVLTFQASSSGTSKAEARFQLAGALDLRLELAGLPASSACRLSLGTHQFSAVSSADGRVTFALAGVTAGDFALICAQEGGEG